MKLVQRAQPFRLVHFLPILPVLGICLAGLLPTAAFGGEILLAQDTSPGVVAAYSTSGSLVNANLLTTTPYLTGIGVSGSNVFVASDSGIIGEYTISGGTVNASLITESGGELGDPVIIGSNLFVANYSNGVIGEYTTSGATVNASLISGIGQAAAMALRRMEQELVYHGL